MTDRSLDVLRVQPQMIPAVRAEFEAAVNHVNSTLTTLKRTGYLSAPWLGDESSSEVAAHYTARSLDAPDSAYAALAAYRDELRRVHDTLLDIEEHYRRTEGDNAATWGLRA